MVSLNLGMEEAILQLSAQFWTATSLDDKIKIFQKFISIGNAVTSEKKESYTKFDLEGEHISIQLIFLDDVEAVPYEFDADVFKLIFLPTKTPQAAIDRITKETSTFAFLFEEDINYIFKGLKIEELSLFKVFYHFIKGNNLESQGYDQDDVQRFYEISTERDISLSDFDIASIIKRLPPENQPRDSIQHDKTNSLTEEIVKEGVSNIILSGKSASGKTTFAIKVADKLPTNWKCYYIESTVLDDEVITGIAIDLIKNLNTESDPVVLIADDLQSNLDGTRKLIQFLNYVQAKFGRKRNISFIGIIWDDFTQEINHLFEIPPTEISVSATDLVGPLIGRCDRSLSRAERESLEKFADNNLFLLSLAIKFLSEDEKKPIEEILAKLPELVFNDLVSRADATCPQFDLEKLFFCLSLFGQYEIDLTSDFLITTTNSDLALVKSLLSKNVIRKRGNGITLGHKSRSRIIFEYLGKKELVWEWYKDEKRLSANADFILEFLKGLQPNQIYSILKKLYENSESVSASNSIIDTWLSIDKILGKILRQQKIDPTWNRAAASALFAIQTLDSFGFNEEADQSIAFFRSFYSIDEKKGSLEIAFERLSSVGDFKKIKSSLIKQDKKESLKGEKGIDLDENEFHKNWLSGVILSAEGFHKSLTNEQLTHLSTTIENQAVNSTYFYPERVSWCSSRVLIGLGLCGRNIDNSTVVKNVANWLLNHPNYNEKKGYWESGTGTWNSWFEATALAISALVTVGVTHKDPKIQRGIGNLLANKNYFTDPDMELDGIFAIQTLSQADVSPFEVQNEIKFLSEWMTTKADWESIKKTSEDTFKQSCQISQSAAGIVEVMWKMVTNDLATVVRAFDKKTTPKENITIFISYEWGSQSFAIDLVNELYSKYGAENVIFDLKNNKGLSSTHFMEKINSVDIVIYLCSKEYKEKADARVKGGVGNEAEHIAKGILERKDKFIPILLEGEWTTEFMPYFWPTTIGISCLDQKLDDKTKKQIHELIEAKFFENQKNDKT